MLIGFSVRNFRCFRDEASISLLASNYYKENGDTLISEEVPGMRGARALPVAAMYGPNASGKSTMIAALCEMRAAVLSSRGAGGDVSFCHQPFVLDDGAMADPTDYTIAFCTSRAVGSDVPGKPARYEYSFSCSDQGVVAEELRAYFSRMPRKLFSRHVDRDGEVVIEGSATFPIANEVKELVGPHTLILSLFAQSGSSKAGKEARMVTDWFEHKLAVVDRSPGAAPLQMFSGEILDGARGSDYQRSFIRQMMRQADTGIDSVDVEHIPFDQGDVPEGVKAFLAPRVIDALRSQPIRRISFKHRTAGTVREVPEESDGTMQLFMLSGYIAQALERGGVLLVDELDASLHPDLANEVISLFLDKRTNPRGAQLIFTAHNPCLMSNELMRRDEFWITQKDDAGAAKLYPISDFKARKGESIQTAYMQGKYAGVPVIPWCFDMCSGKPWEGGEQYGSNEQVSKE